MQPDQINPVQPVHLKPVQLNPASPSQAESSQISLKREQKRRKSLRNEDLQVYLDERMWRQWRGGGPDVIMRNFIAILQVQFPVDTPVP